MAQYFRNIGRNVFAGDIPESTLSIIISELKKVASKNTCVACFRVSTRKRFKLISIVGNKKQYDNEGNYAFKYTETPEKHLPMTPELRAFRNYLIELNVLAALFHDVGKEFYFFQHKINPHAENKKLRDPVRHEMLSFQIAQQIFNIKDIKDPLTYYQRVKEKFINWLDELNIKSLKAPSLSEKFENMPETWKPKKQHFLAPVLHLILSHHRISNDKDQSSVLNTYVDEKSLPKNYHEVFNLYERRGESIFLNELGKHILNQFDTIIKLIDEEINNTYFLELVCDHQSIMNITQYLLRPSLVLADQLFSQRDLSQNPRPMIEEEAFANTITNDDKTPCLNQTLLEHLLGVAKLTRKTTRYWFNEVYHQTHQHLNDLEQAPSAITDPVSFSQFKWQTAAQNSVKAAIPEDGEYGFVGIVMSKTGSGKTIGNIKIISEACKHQNLRVSCLLGMKSLTLETFKQYKTHLKIGKKFVKGIIGSDLAERLYNQDNDSDELSNQLVLRKLVDINNNFYQNSCMNINLKKYYELCKIVRYLHRLPNCSKLTSYRYRML